MPESNNAARKTTKASTGSSQQPGRYLLSVRTYRETIRTLSQMLIKTSWLELTSKSTVFITVDSQLRDTIYNLELLGDDPVRNRIEMDAVLKALNDALIELLGASMLADDAKVQVRLTSLNKIRVCRDYLNLAVGLMDC